MSSYRFAGIETAANGGSIPAVTGNFYKSSAIDLVELKSYKIPLGESLKIFYKLPKKVETLRDFDAVIFPSLQYAAAAPFNGTFSVFYIHDLYRFTKKRNVISTIVFGKALQNLSEFDLIIANSHHTKNSLENIFYKELDIEVVEPGVNDFYFEVDVEVEENKLLYVGSFQKRKNTKFLLEVLDELPDKFTLTCAGRYYSEENKQDFMNLVSKKGLENRVQVVGECSEERLRELYSSSGFYFHPAKKGGWEITPLEAASCNTTVIVNSSIPSSRRLSDQNIVFDEFDAHSLANRILESKGSEIDHKKRTWDDARADLVSTIKEKVGKYD